MQRCQHWISPERVHSLMSTGSGDWSIRLSVVIWIAWGNSWKYCCKPGWRYYVSEGRWKAPACEAVSTWTSNDCWHWWHQKAHYPRVTEKTAWLMHIAQTSVYEKGRTAFIFLVGDPFFQLQTYAHGSWKKGLPEREGLNINKGNAMI